MSRVSDDKSSAPRERSGLDWLLHPERPLMRILAFIIAFGGALGVGFLIYDRLVPKSPEPPTVIVQQGGGAVETSAPREESSLRERVAQLQDGVQVSRFEEILGKPSSSEQLRDGFLHTEWRATEAVVIAFTDSLDQVVAYTVTAMSPTFVVAVPATPGGVRLVSSTFADTGTDPAAASGVYPPSGRWSYEELHGGGFATQYRQVVLAAGFTSTAASEAAATDIPDLADCLPSSLWEEDGGCSPERRAALRAMHVTSMTIGEADRLRELSAAGAVFFAEE